MFNFNEHLQELRASLIKTALLVFTVVIGFVWIAIGLYSFLVSAVGPGWGALIVGALFMVPFLIYTLLSLMSTPPRPPELPHNHHSGADDAILNISKIIESLSGQSPLLVTLVAVVAGFLATRFPAILSVFTQLLVAYAEDVKMKSARAAQQAQSSHDQTSQAETSHNGTPHAETPQTTSMSN